MLGLSYLIVIALIAALLASALKSQEHSLLVFSLIAPIFLFAAVTMKKIVTRHQGKKNQPLGIL